ncbi:MAG: DNA mismatch repair protein MutS, partial [Cyanobacteria bacterium NC_groundwater_1444_Ag_S-0.65um_54_12]|nr:DNA mismatch repair protein MutS [Cyanobacteria bacterium NC_groundwater_1444_Ag_S-0.65um_54_12]
MPELKSPAAYSPMMQHYLEVKKLHPDCLLMYRMGDFYELFFADATVAAKELEITLTARESAGERVPMAGVPHHAVEGYLGRLIEKGYRIAICEQVEDPRQAKGLVKREITRLVTPGTLLEAHYLSEKQNNFLAALYRGAKGFGLAYCDISTGEFMATEIGNPALVASELQRLAASEILVPVPPALWQEVAWGRGQICLTPERLDPAWAEAMVGCHALTPRPEQLFKAEQAKRAILEHFKILTLEPFGLAEKPMATAACGALLAYIAETQCQRLPPFQAIVTYQLADFMWLDADTRRNLELLQTARAAQTSGSLLAVLDITLTPMGGRRLRSWLLHPLLNTAAIQARQAAVTELLAATSQRQRIVRALSQVRDLERIATRITTGTVYPRELIALRDSLEALPELSAALARFTSTLLAPLQSLPEQSGELATLIRRTLVDNPPATITEGGLIRPGITTEIDRLR